MLFPCIPVNRVSIENFRSFQIYGWERSQTISLFLKLTLCWTLISSQEGASHGTKISPLSHFSFTQHKVLKAHPCCRMKEITSCKAAQQSLMHIYHVLNFLQIWDIVNYLEIEIQFINTCLRPTHLPFPWVCPKVDLLDHMIHCLGEGTSQHFPIDYFPFPTSGAYGYYPVHVLNICCKLFNMQIFKFQISHILNVEISTILKV